MQKKLIFFFENGITKRDDNTLTIINANEKGGNEKIKSSIKFIIMRTLLLILGLLLMCNMHSIAQCFHGSEKQKLQVYSSTGSTELDEYLNSVKLILEDTYSIRVELKVFNDGNSPNAYANTNSSNQFYFDGSVFLGKNLLDKEIHKNENGLDAVSGIMAHEFAHILQTKMDCTLKGSLLELHADFLSGYYMGKSGLYTEDGLKAFGESLYEKGDIALWDETHHGTPQQRYRAMMGGYRYSKEVSTPEKAYHLGVSLFTNNNGTGEIGINQIENKQPAKSVVVTYNNTKYDEVYSIKFATNNTEYNGLLLLKEGKGVLRLLYMNKGKEKIVEQTMEIKEGKNGNYVQGSNPTDPTTRTKLIDYYPDSFYLYTDDYKKTTEIWMIDTKGNSGKVTSAVITDKQLADDWLDNLRWR